MALRPSTFISTALTGSTTEPVIRNRTISVDSDDHGEDERQMAREAVLEVDEARRSGRRHRRRTGARIARTACTSRCVRRR